VISLISANTPTSGDFGHIHVKVAMFAIFFEAIFERQACCDKKYPISIFIDMRSQHGVKLVIGRGCIWAGDWRKNVTPFAKSGASKVLILSELHSMDSLLI